MELEGSVWGLWGREKAGLNLTLTMLVRLCDGLCHSKEGVGKSAPSELQVPQVPHGCY